MDANSLKLWDLNVPRPQGQSISGANSRAPMASSTTTQNAILIETPTKQANESIDYSPSSNKGRDGSTSSTHNPWVKKYILTLGTSTGGLIAIMLSRLRMNIDDCIQEYENLGKEVFAHPRIFSIRGPIPFKRGKFDHRKLEKVIKDVVERRRLEGDQIAETMYPSNPDRCRTIVFAIREKNFANAPYLFRTYEHRESACNYVEQLNPGPAQPVKIWEVARATTAAPTYFKPFQLGNERFVDGGFGVFCNNPTSRAFAEIEQIHGKGTVALTLSIGTGRPTQLQPIEKHKSTLCSHVAHLIRYMADAATNAENTHEYVQKLLEAQGCPYERFNVEGGLGDVDLGEWRMQRGENVTLKKINEQTDNYLNQPDVRRRMERVAKMLVDNRLERAKTSRWKVVFTDTGNTVPNGVMTG
ncbi:hypothetical protein EYC84_008495 [Monilinia fructicola]|uniref:PNPLA domain-containing protein n=1 Tax=Monilinia fructicola TaxID=38448 RepID=A0A5M9JFC7_MONFR|nr:hypothetical protein EYC84_008495 [Monilinia fructicola]